MVLERKKNGGVSEEWEEDREERGRKKVILDGRWCKGWMGWEGKVRRGWKGYVKCKGRKGEKSCVGK